MVQQIDSTRVRPGSRRGILSDSLSFTPPNLVFLNKHLVPLSLLSPDGFVSMTLSVSLCYPVSIYSNPFLFLSKASSLGISENL
eukprot:1321194-Amorphochlora_amoeboformis.AAC.1